MTDGDGDMPKLSDFAAAANYAVVRDAGFRHAGKIPTKLDAIFVPVSAEKYIAALKSNPRIVAVLTTPELADLVPAEYGVAVAEEVLESHARLQRALVDEPGLLWQTFPTEILEGANIHPSAIVSEHDVRIGRNVVIHPNVTILPRTVIGDDVTLRSGAVIGTEAFEVARIDGRQVVLPQAGGVWIGDNVEVQAQTCVVRAIYGGFTRIEQDVVIDNMVHVAHDVAIGRGTVVGACAMLGGRTEIGVDCYIAPAAVLSNGLTIGDRAKITLGAVVTRDVPPDGHVSGHFAVEHHRFIEFIKSIR